MNIMISTSSLNCLIVKLLTERDDEISVFYFFILLFLNGRSSDGSGKVAARQT